MAFYADEDSVWKCADHPSKRRRIGVCPACLREKLSILCSDCAMARPCACSSSASSSSSSSISFPGDAAFSRSVGGGRSVSRVSNFADSEPEFRRSRSVAVSVFRSVRLSGAGSENRRDPAPESESDGKRRPWLWLFFWPKRSNKAREEDEAGEFGVRRVSRSRSVAESARSVRSKAWYFPSPMKVFRYSKGSKNARERSSSLHGA